MRVFHPLIALAAMLPAFALALPDLAITQLGYSSGAITSVVLNKGDAQTTAGRSIGVAFYIDGTKRATGLSVAQLAAGWQATIAGKYQLPPGVHELAAEVDDLGLIAEADETNNWLRVPVYIQPPPTPVPTPTPTPVPTSSPVIAAITVDMGASDAPAHGIETWGSSTHALVEYPLPAGYSAATGWGAVYRDTTDAMDSNTRVALRDYRVWTLNRAGRWALVSNPANTAIAGDRYPENFHGTNSGNATRTEPDGSLSQKMAHGYAWHFFANRFPVDTNIVGIVSSVSARLVVDNPALPDDRATARYLFAMGGDWWRSMTAGYAGYNKDPSLSNNAEMGWSKLKRVTNEWQTVRFTNVPLDIIAKNPPPL